VRHTVIKQMDEYKDEVELEKQYKVKLYNYPEYEDPIGIFDEDELQNDEAMIVLCVRAQPDDETRKDHTAYVWTGPSFEVGNFGDTGLTEQQFVHKCIDNYWKDQEADRKQVKIVTVDSNQPSDEFMFYFDED